MTKYTGDLENKNIFLTPCLLGSVEEVELEHALQTFFCSFQRELVFTHL